MSDNLVKRLRLPPFGTETSERNLMLAAADRIDALTQSRAETAAAYERAAEMCDKHSYSNNQYVSTRMSDASREIRALATQDHTAALNTLIADAEARGMRKAADIAENIEEALRQGYAATSANAVGEVYLAILAAIPKGGDA